MRRAKSRRFRKAIKSFTRFDLSTLKLMFFELIKKSYHSHVTAAG